MTKVLKPVCLTIVLALVLALGVALMPMTNVGASPDGPFIITANNSDDTIHTVDTATNTVYGPFRSEDSASLFRTGLTRGFPDLLFDLQ